MAGAFALGIDIGGTQVRAGLVDASGALIRRKTAPTDARGGPDAVLKQLAQLAAEVCGPKMRDVAGIGVATAGPLDTASGTIIDIPTLPGWKGFPLRRRLEVVFGSNVRVEGDAIAAAYGEWQFGAGRSLRHLVYVTVSTGIGGGVVLDGRLAHGRCGLAGHVGHLRLAESGPTCSCGAMGCFEAFASGRALDRLAQEAVREHPTSLLATLSQGTNADARRLFEAARSGDAVCVDIVRREAAYLGLAFTSLIHLYSPERVIVGGGVSRDFDLLDEGIHAIIRRDALAPFRDIPVVPAGLGEDSGLVGAAALAFT